MGLVVITITFACKPRRLDESVVKSDSVTIEYVQTEVRGSDGRKHQVQVLKPRKGVWAYGRDPRGELSLWPDPEGHYEMLYDGRYSWPKNWPISPTGAMPYEKLFSYERFRAEKRRSGKLDFEKAIVGDKDYHFDCDDFALAQHRWCAFNAGKKCISVRVRFFGDSLKKTTPENANYDAPQDSAYSAVLEAPGLDLNDPQKAFSTVEVASKSSSSPEGWIQKYMGNYRLLPGEAVAPEESSRLEISVGNQKRVLLSANVKKGRGYIFEETSPCELADTSYYCHDLVKLESDRKVYLFRKYVKKQGSEHIMIVHETENIKGPAPKYCLIEYYYYPNSFNIDNRQPKLYGCWEGSSSLPRGKIPQNILNQVRLGYINKTAITQRDKVSFEPIHFEINDNLSLFKMGEGLKRMEMTANQSVLNLREPDYGRSKLSATVFAYFTGLHPLYMNPLTSKDMRMYGLNSASALGNNLTRAGLFHGTRIDLNPFAKDSDFSDREDLSFDDRIKALIDLQEKGLLQK